MHDEIDIENLKWTLHLLLNKAIEDGYLIGSVIWQKSFDSKISVRR